MPARRAEAYTSGKASTTRSTSAAVEVCPRLNRCTERASSSSTPRASSTWEGRGTPAEQADPVEDSTPTMSRPNRIESPSQPGKTKWTLAGDRRVPGGRARPVCGSRSSGPIRRASGTTSRMPAMSRSRRAPSRSRSVSSRARASVAATAKASMSGVGRVPERMSRSWPPPCWTGVRTASRRTSRAPMPTGPPILCPVTARVVAPEAAKSTGTAPRAWTASVWNGTPWEAASAAASATGWTVPISLLTHIRVATATVSGSRARALSQACRSTEPSAWTGTRSTCAPSCSSSQAAASRTAWCSTPVSTIRWRSGRDAARAASRRAQNRPLRARLSASVPPEVKTTSLGWAPTAAAMASRAVSTRSLALRPDWCSEDWFPTVREAAVNASRATGRRTVVAAWSR